MSDKDDLKNAIKEAINEARTLDYELHKEHHAWIAQEILTQKAKRERRDKILTAVLTVSAISGLAYVGKAVWSAITSEVLK